MFNWSPVLVQYTVRKHFFLVLGMRSGKQDLEPAVFKSQENCQISGDCNGTKQTPLVQGILRTPAILSQASSGSGHKKRVRVSVQKEMIYTNRHQRISR